MIELRELLDADAHTPSEVGTFADPASRWITVDAAELLIERLHPAARPVSPPDLARVPGTARRDEVGAPTRRSEPLDRMTAVEGSSSDVTSPSARHRPPSGGGRPTFTTAGVTGLSQRVGHG